MRCGRLIFAAILVLALAGVAQATPVDPKIIIGDPLLLFAVHLTPGNTNVTFTFDSIDAFSNNFGARSNFMPACMGGTTGGLPSMTCGIINDTNAPLSGFTFSFTSGQMLSLAQTSPGTWTSNCDMNGMNCTSATFLFNPPLPDSEIFGALITFVNFNAGLPISAASVPEPATLTLMAGGLAALLFNRRGRKAVS